MEIGFTILIVEDDGILAGEICRFLEKWGYRAVAARRFDDIASEFLSCRAHLVLMDINLPYYDGFYWCRKIREASDVPILYISSRGDDRDKIMAMAQGGDDYVEKPFHLELLKAKIEALLRRAYQYKAGGPLRLMEDLYFDKDSFSLIYQGKELELTKSEQKIMARLADAKPNVVTREELMTELWSTDEFVSDGTLSTLVSRLRGKLKECCKSEVICTKKGQGYFIA